MYSKISSECSDNITICVLSKVKKTRPTSIARTIKKGNYTIYIIIQIKQAY
jgi:hypothetical protein